ncbi:LysM peptidoglycan-binding domain-containing protein [Parafrankia discariae]|uniref:LysM peptidoglycan-binding domain-containing protein n=1 Tax=Parafrankia discariae TaxID=365528 RepID=UPI00036845DD|nr:LysM peptidoglycan-binding domain-containing protein [Parafrankia discariae]
MPPSTPARRHTRTPTRKAPARPAGAARRIGAGLAALLALAVPLVAVPPLAWQYLGSPLPGTLPSGAEVGDLLLSPDDGTVVLAVIRTLVWVGWVVFAGCALLDVAAQLRHRPTRSLPGLGWMQAATGPLVAAVVLLLLSAPGVALADSAIPGALASPAVAVSAAAIPAQTTVAPAPPAATAADLYVVGDGDTLWSIAGSQLPATADCPDPHLRWTEIADLNRGLPQADGHTLTDPDLIRPGWQLHLPADAYLLASPPPPANPQSAPAPADPQPAPSLSPQADLPPAHPDLTTPPAATPATPGPQTAPFLPAIPPTLAPPPVSTAPPAPTSTAPTGTAPTPESPTVQPGGDTYPQDTPRAHTEARSWLPVELLGAGLTAAGLLWLLRRRRLRRQLAADLGDLPPQPTPAAGGAEAAASAGADLDGAQFLHLALLLLAATAEHTGGDLPDLHTAYLSASSLDLHFAVPTPLPPPPPYTALTDTHWQLPRAVDARTLDPDGTLADTVIAPYPGLTLLGYTTPTAADGRVAILVDLEHVRSVQLRGAPERTDAVLRFAALGLLTSGWATYLQLTVAGLPEPLTDAAPDRAETVDAHDLDGPLTVLETQHASQLARLQRGGAPTLTARVTGVGPAPHLLLLATEPANATQADRLADLARPGPRTGIGILSATALPQPGLTIDVDDQGLLHLPGTATPPLAGSITLPTATAITEALTGAAAPPADEGPHLDWDTDLPYDAPSAPLAPTDLPVLAIPDPAAGSVLVEPPPGGMANAEDPDPQPLAPPSPVSDGHEVSRPAVLIRLMGTVTVDGGGPAPASRSHARTATEILAYLALHAGTADRQDLTDALWPPGRLDGAGREVAQPARRTLFAHISRARALAGVTTAGAPRLAAGDPGEPLQLSRDVLTDWQLLQRLRDTAWDTAGPDLIAGLQAALDLVTGPLPRPQSRNGVEGGWLWLSTTELHHHLPPTAVEIAVRLAEAYLHAEDPTRARAAVVKLLEFGEPEFSFDERLWQLRILTDFHLGGDEAAWATVTLLEAMLRDRARYMDDPDYAEMSPELDRFITELLRTRPATATGS